MKKIWIMNVSKKFDSGFAYLIYCILIVAFVFVLVVSAQVFTEFQLIYQIIAAFIATVATSIITMILLKQQAKANREMIEQQTKANREMIDVQIRASKDNLEDKTNADMLREFKREFLKVRYQRAHEYLDELFSVIEDGRLTKKEAMQMEFKLQHILLGTSTSYDFEDEDIPEVLNMETVEKISFLTKKILGSVVKKNDMSQIHEDMTSLTLCLYETFYYGLEEYSGNALYRKNIVQNFCDIYKMAEASEKLNGKA